MYWYRFGKKSGLKVPKMKSMGPIFFFFLSVYCALWGTWVQLYSDTTESKLSTILKRTVITEAIWWDRCSWNCFGTPIENTIAPSIYYESQLSIVVGLYIVNNTSVDGFNLNGFQIVATLFLNERLCWCNINEVIAYVGVAEPVQVGFHALGIKVDWGWDWGWGSRFVSLQNFCYFRIQFSEKTEKVFLEAREKFGYWGSDIR